LARLFTGCFMHPFTNIATKINHLIKLIYFTVCYPLHLSLYLLT